ncbi:hypothetical protein ACJX0J_030269, partial [Zea mays]
KKLAFFASPNGILCTGDSSWLTNESHVGFTEHIVVSSPLEHYTVATLQKVFHITLMRYYSLQKLTCGGFSELRYGYFFYNIYYMIGWIDNIHIFLVSNWAFFYGGIFGGMYIYMYTCFFSFE